MYVKQRHMCGSALLFSRLAFLPSYGFLYVVDLLLSLGFLSLAFFTLFSFFCLIPLFFLPSCSFFLFLALFFLSTCSLFSLFSCPCLPLSCIPFVSSLLLVLSLLTLSLYLHLPFPRPTLQGRLSCAFLFRSLDTTPSAPGTEPARCDRDTSSVTCK